ncbi:MAG: hypothetical protein ACYDH6_18290 [Acidimicrobiales bacterium]
MSDRFVVLGLAPARCRWFRDVAQWANDGSIPVEFVKCVSAEEVRARLAGSRPFSALLVDGTSTLDRDLVRVALDVACPTLVVGAATDQTLAVAATLPVGFDSAALIDVLSRHARSISVARDDASPEPAAPAIGRRAPLIAVTGPGGTGASTCAIALAQGFADVDITVLLADFRRHAELAMLHDAGDIIPGVEEVVDAFRAGTADPRLLATLTFGVRERGYRLLLGLRRGRAWATLRPAAFTAALDSLRLMHGMVVADVDPELEGEQECGSIDVEERNLMARITCDTAAAVVVVGSPGMKGLHALTRVIGELRDHGVEDARILSVVNRAPRHPRARAELCAALHRLLPDGASPAGVIFLSERRIDDALLDGDRLPGAICDPLVAAVLAVSTRAGDADRTPRAAVRVVPGRLGSWRPEAVNEW